MINTIKKNKYWIIVILLYIVLKSSLIFFGLPYSFHPDETYILKDPFKIVFNYLNGNFEVVFNLTYYIQLFWYGLLYILGSIINLWGNFSEYKSLLIVENEIFLLWGRILSVILSTGAGIIAIKIISHITPKKNLQYLFGITFLLNPFEIVSNVWIKYDSYVYLATIIILYYAYLFIAKNNTKVKKKLFFAILIGITIRIDLIITIIPVVLWEIKKITYHTVTTYLKNNFNLLGKCMIVYCFITLLPVVLVYNQIFASSSEAISIVEPFWKVILQKLIFTFKDYSIVSQNIINNGSFYLFDCLLLGLGPLFFIVLILTIKRFHNYKYIIIPLGLYLLVLLLFPDTHMHYFLFNSVLVFIVSFIQLSGLKNHKYVVMTSLFNLIYIGSFTLSFLWMVHFYPDTRISAKKYILSKVDKNELIGIQQFIIPGMFPPIEESKKVLSQKAKVVRELGLGTGLTLDEKSKNTNEFESRKILSISTLNPWKEIGIKNGWNCVISDTNCVKISWIQVFNATL